MCCWVNECGWHWDDGDVFYVVSKDVVVVLHDLLLANRIYMMNKVSTLLYSE